MTEETTIKYYRSTTEYLGATNGDPEDVWGAGEYFEVPADNLPTHANQPWNDATQTWDEVVILSEIEAWRFWSILEIEGLKEALYTALDALPGNAGIVAKVRLERTTDFDPYDDLVQKTKLALAMTDEQFIGLWKAAEEL